MAWRCSLRSGVAMQLAVRGMGPALGWVRWSFDGASRDWLGLKNFIFRRACYRSLNLGFNLSL